MEKVRQLPPNRALETSTEKESHRIPFVVTFNPLLLNIGQVISSNLKIIRSSQRCLAAFSLPLVYHTAVAKKKRVLSLQREPCLTIVSLPTNNDVYGITSPALLLISSV